MRFASFLAGAEAVRAVVQAGLRPANCRLIDAARGRIHPAHPAGDGERAVLVLGFESTDHDVEHELARALELCRAHGGEPDEPAAGARDGAGAWREAFLRMPYLRDMLVRLGILTDTFETAITWERLPAFHEAVVGATRAALGEPCRVTCRFTHVYPDGPAPYFTVLAPARRGDEVEQWPRSRARPPARSSPRAGRSPTTTPSAATTGRWYDVQRPEPFAAALRAAKAAVDPNGLLNPGVFLPGSMSAEGKNFEAITKAKAAPQRQVPVPAAHGAHEPVRDRADAVGGGRHHRRPRARGRPKVGTGAFRLVCDGMEPARARDRGGRGDQRPGRAPRGPGRPTSREPTA